MPLEDNEAWIHLIKAIMVKKDISGVPRLEEVYDSGNEPFDSCHGRVSGINKICIS